MIDYSQSFLATWGIYPKRSGQKRGKSTAFAEWEKLTTDDQRAAYADIRDRNYAGGWEYVRDMERYLKRREWEDEWTGAKVVSDPDLIDAANSITIEQLSDYAASKLPLCEHQIRMPWSYFGSQPGVVHGVVVPACNACGKPNQRVKTSEVPA